MSLKGKIQQRFDLVIGSTPRSFRQVPTPPNLHFPPQTVILTDQTAYYFKIWPKPLESDHGVRRGESFSNVGYALLDLVEIHQRTKFHT
ncbi:hypothetical protein CEXT_123191 [Caerostris extrusa]|uniref:Uncharacterized protein n=1 Tax=Caerostris extrusa TaxID=172846 RepID=A0AAV4XUS0_CAEEX|nr:hypothetical protein CEXT_123191 [Caerostris extrusa]